MFYLLLAIIFTVINSSICYKTIKVANSFMDGMSLREFIIYQEALVEKTGNQTQELKELITKLPQNNECKN